MNFDLFLNLNEQISFKNYERDFRVKFNVEAAKDFPNIMCDYFFPGLDEFIQKLETINKEQATNNIIYDQVQKNNSIFFYQFCLVKFFTGIYYMLKILKNYYINFSDGIDNVKVQIHNLKVKMFNVITSLTFPRSESSDIIELFKCSVKDERFNVIEVFQRLEHKNFMDESYLKNDEEEYYNIYVCSLVN